MTKSTLNHASFWQRLGAHILDVLILNFTLGILGGILGAISGIIATIDGLAVLGTILYFITLVIIILAIVYYYVYFETKNGATPGKAVLGIKVVNEEGGTITRKESVVRFLVKFILSGILYIGFLMVLFREDKKALHDVLAKTNVVVGK